MRRATASGATPVGAYAERRATDPATGPEANKAVVRRFYEQVLLRGQADLLGEIVDDHVIGHLSLGGRVVGRAAVAELVRLYTTASGARHLDVVSLLAAGPRVAARYLHYAVDADQSGPDRRTGGKLVSGLAIFRLNGGAIAEFWLHDEVFRALPQAVGSPEGARSCAERS